MAVRLNTRRFVVGEKVVVTGGMREGLTGVITDGHATISSAEVEIDGAIHRISYEYLRVSE